MEILTMNVIFFINFWNSHFIIIKRVPVLVWSIVIYHKTCTDWIDFSDDLTNVFVHFYSYRRAEYKYTLQEIINLIHQHRHKKYVFLR